MTEPELTDAQREFIQEYMDRRAEVAAQHLAEAEMAWAKLPPKARKTAVERGFGAHLPEKARKAITKRHVIER